MTDFAQDLPPELQAELGSILTRRKLAADQASRYAGGYLGAAGRRQLGETDQQMKELTSRYNTGLQGAVQNYMQTKLGAPAIPQPADELGGGPGRPEMAADPRKAVMEALMSQYGPLARVGQSELAHQQKLEDAYTLNEGDKRIIPGPGGSAVGQREVHNPKLPVHEIPATWEQDLPQGSTRLPTDPAGIFRLTGTDGQKDVYEVTYERGKRTGYKKLDSSQIIKDPTQGNQTQTIQDPLDPTKTLVVKVGSFNEAKYRAGDKTGVVGAGPKPSTEGVSRAEGFSTFQNVNANLDKLEKQVELTLGSKLGRVTGIPGALWNVPGMAGADAAGRLEGLKSQIGFEALQALRNAAHNGASGLGQVTEKEHVYLQTQLGNLAKAQSETEVRRVLGDIKTWIGQARERYKSAYEKRYNAGPTAPTKPPEGYTPL